MRHLAQHTFSARPQTGRAARGFAMQALDSWGRCQRGGVIPACVSELAGHAAQHGSPDGCTNPVRLIRHSHCLYVAVHDGAFYFRVRIPPAVLSGAAERRIRIVQELCNAWGVRALTGKGKAARTCFRRPEAHVSRCAVTPRPSTTTAPSEVSPPAPPHPRTPAPPHPRTPAPPHPEGNAMGLSWQQGPLSAGAIGHFLTPEPLPERLLFAERLRRRMRVKFNGSWIADSEDVILLHEPGRYPVAYFPREDVGKQSLIPSSKVTHHKDLGDTAWYAVHAGERTTERAAWEFTALPGYAADLQGRIAFAWRAMDAFYEEDERVLGHAADPYHRIDIRNTSRTLEVRLGDTLIARSEHPLVLFESGFAPRWYVPRADIDQTQLHPVDGQTFCPYKGLCNYYDIGDARHAAWSYTNAYQEVDRISGLVSFEADKVEVSLDGTRLHLEPGQSVVPHGVDRGLDVDEVKAH
ncbi:DUF427 domain-containing protein [Streptomyces sp. NPDC058695]|uniref:DUF427 domain-containing protein n=1 Tax=Streptomyces sp. NPDC058695 TaxID=3346604 RepID=UPI003648D3B9